MEKDVISIKDFLQTHEKELNEKIIQNTSPIFYPEKYDSIDKIFADEIQKTSKLTPFLPQKDVIIATRKHLNANKSVFQVAEMSCGKSMMSILATVICQKPGRHLVMCPPHLVRKWVKEVNKVIPESVGTAFNINSKRCIEKLKNLPESKPRCHEFYVASRERWKNSYSWKHANLPKRRTKGNDGKEYLVNTCPKCGTSIDYDHWFLGRKNYCQICNEALWEADRSKFRRFSPAEYVKKRFKKNYFTTLIADELHELKGESAQGVAFGQLAGKCKNVIGLTGTLVGGYADDIFYLLWRMFPGQMVSAGEKFGNKVGFIDKYGVFEKKYRICEDDNKSTKTLRQQSVKRRPGISPLVLSKFLIPNSIFMKMTDLHDALPAYQEHMHSIRLNNATAEEYQSFESTLQEEMLAALRRGDKTVLSRMLQSLLSWPDGCRKNEYVYDGAENCIASAKAQELQLTNKEEKLIEIIKESKKVGKRVLIFAEFTGTRDITPTINDVLELHGISTLVLKSTVQAEKRQDWIEEKLQQRHYDCMICNPRLVQTGLDLLYFPTLIFFQTGMSVYVMRQASRRSWRIGQEEDVDVHFLCYRETMQEKLLTMMAKKMETSLAIEGDLTESGLSNLVETGDNLVLEMARAIVENTSFGSLDTAWKNYRNLDEKLIGFKPADTMIRRKKQSVVQFKKPERKNVRFQQLELFAV